jgi:muconolactone D-isomerase
MEFLVRIEIGWPPGEDEVRRQDLIARETVRASELAASGNLVRLWRSVGSWGNIGIWEATDATELQALLSSLPLFPWMRIGAEPLAVHPSDPPGAKSAPSPGRRSPAEILDMKE